MGGTQTHTHTVKQCGVHVRRVRFRADLIMVTPHLGAAVAARRWLRPSLDAQWDEQSERWHTSRRRVNSNKRRLSVKAHWRHSHSASTELPVQPKKLKKKKIMAEADRADVILQPVVFMCLHTVTSQRHMNDKFDWTHGSWTAWRFHTRLPPSVRVVRLVFQVDLHRLNFN